MYLCNSTTENPNRKVDKRVKYKCPQYVHWPRKAWPYTQCKHPIVSYNISDKLMSLYIMQLKISQLQVEPMYLIHRSVKHTTHMLAEKFIDICFTSTKFNLTDKNESFSMLIKWVKSNTNLLKIFECIFKLSHCKICSTSPVITLNL